MISNLKTLNLSPQVCYRDAEPINLYHKVGHGTLDMYVLSPSKDSKEVKDFLHKWNNNDQKLFSNQKINKDLPFPLQNLVSVCALLVWQPANPDDNVTRILYPGSAPQQKIFEGLDRLRSLEYIKYPTCSENKLLINTSIISFKSKQIKDNALDKLIQSEEKTNKLFTENKLKDKAPKKPDMKVKQENKLIEANDKVELTNGTVDSDSAEKTVKKSESTDSEKSIKSTKIKKNEKLQIIEKAEDKVKQKVESKVKADIKVKSKIDSKPPERKKPSVEKKSSPTTPKKVIESKVNGEITKRLSKISPSATPAKSVKEASNRRVIESKYKSVGKKDIKEVKEVSKLLEKKEKPERKPISHRVKAVPAAPKAAGSPIKKVNGVQKPDSIFKKGKLDKEGTTDSSTVSTPSADQKDLSKLTTEEIEQLKAQELADLKEEQEVVKEIEAVFRKGEEQLETDSELRKVKDSSIEDKTEPEEYLIIEREEIDHDSLDEKEIKEDEIQKLTRDSEESEKMRKLSDDIKPAVIEKEVDIQDKVKEEDKPLDVSKEVSATTPEDKIDVSLDKKIPEIDGQDQNIALESQPDEKFSATIESGATTAPTLPEDERIPLDEIKEDNGDQVIEEKHVKEDTKEKDVPLIQLPPRTVEQISKLPAVVGIRLDKQSHIRDIVKTPDEVADLPVHEEADIEQYEMDMSKPEEVIESKTEKLSDVHKLIEKSEVVESKEVKISKTPEDEKLPKESSPKITSEDLDVKKEITGVEGVDDNIKKVEDQIVKAEDIKVEKLKTDVDVQIESKVKNAVDTEKAKEIISVEKPSDIKEDDIKPPEIKEELPVVGEKEAFNDKQIEEKEVEDLGEEKEISTQGEDIETKIVKSVKEVLTVEDNVKEDLKHDDILEQVSKELAPSVEVLSKESETLIKPDVETVEKEESLDYESSKLKSEEKTVISDVKEKEEKDIKIKSEELREETTQDAIQTLDIEKQHILKIDLPAQLEEPKETKAEFVEKEETKLEHVTSLKDKEDYAVQHKQTMETMEVKLDNKDIDDVLEEEYLKHDKKETGKSSSSEDVSKLSKELEQFQQTDEFQLSKYDVEKMDVEKAVSEKDIKQFEIADIKDNKDVTYQKVDKEDIDSDKDIEIKRLEVENDIEKGEETSQIEDVKDIDAIEESMDKLKKHEESFKVEEVEKHLSEKTEKLDKDRPTDIFQTKSDSEEKKEPHIDVSPQDKKVITKSDTEIHIISETSKQVICEPKDESETLKPDDSVKEFDVVKPVEAPQDQSKKVDDTQKEQQLIEDVAKDKDISTKEKLNELVPSLPAVPKEEIEEGEKALIDSSITEPIIVDEKSISETLLITSDGKKENLVDISIKEEKLKDSLTDGDLEVTETKEIARIPDSTEVDDLKPKLLTEDIKGTKDDSVEKLKSEEKEEKIKTTFEEKPTTVKQEDIMSVVKDEVSFKSDSIASDIQISPEKVTELDKDSKQKEDIILLKQEDKEETCVIKSELSGVVPLEKEILEDEETSKELLVEEDHKPKTTELTQTIKHEKSPSESDEMSVKSSTEEIVSVVDDKRLKDEFSENVLTTLKQKEEPTQLSKDVHDKESTVIQETTSIVTKESKEEAGSEVDIPIEPPKSDDVVHVPHEKDVPQEEKPLRKLEDFLEEQKVLPEQKSKDSEEELSEKVLISSGKSVSDTKETKQQIKAEVCTEETKLKEDIGVTETKLTEDTGVTETKLKEGGSVSITTEKEKAQIYEEKEKDVVKVDADKIATTPETKQQTQDIGLKKEVIVDDKDILEKLKSSDVEIEDKRKVEEELIVKDETSQALEDISLKKESHDDKSVSLECKLDDVIKKIEKDEEDVIKEEKVYNQKTLPCEFSADTEVVHADIADEDSSSELKVTQTTPTEIISDKPQKITGEKEIKIVEEDENKELEDRKQLGSVEEIVNEKDELETNKLTAIDYSIEEKKKVQDVLPEKEQLIIIKDDSIIKSEQPKRPESQTESPETSSDQTIQTFRESEIIDKIEVGRKSPKEREEDVAIIVASVAEVLKSDAPLEEFEGKIPLTISPFVAPSTSELTKDIQTLEVEKSDLDSAKIDESDIPKERETKSPESKMSSLIKDSKELIEATSKMISDIKSSKIEDITKLEGEISIHDEEISKTEVGILKEGEAVLKDTNRIEEREEEISTLKEETLKQEGEVLQQKEDILEKDDDILQQIDDIKLEEIAKQGDESDVVTVHRMLVTASSEDGGEETEICPTGTITFSKSSESSGRTSPDISIQKGSIKTAKDDDIDGSQRSSRSSTPDIKITPDIDKLETIDRKEDVVDHTESDSKLKDKSSRSSTPDSTKISDPLKDKVEKEKLEEITTTKDLVDSLDIETKSFDSRTSSGKSTPVESTTEEKSEIQVKLDEKETDVKVPSVIDTSLGSKISSRSSTPESVHSTVEKVDTSLEKYDIDKVSKLETKDTVEHLLIKEESSILEDEKQVDKSDDTKSTMEITKETMTASKPLDSAKTSVTEEKKVIEKDGSSIEEEHLQKDQIKKEVVPVDNKSIRDSSKETAKTPDTEREFKIEELKTLEFEKDSSSSETHVFEKDKDIKESKSDIVSELHDSLDAQKESLIEKKDKQTIDDEKISSPKKSDDISDTKSDITSIETVEISTLSEHKSEEIKATENEDKTEIESENIKQPPTSKELQTDKSIDVKFEDVTPGKTDVPSVSPVVIDKKDALVKLEKDIEEKGDVRYATTEVKLEKEEEQKKKSESRSSPEVTRDEVTSAEDEHISKDTKIHEPIPTSKLEETAGQQEKLIIESTLPSSIDDKHITEVMKSTTQADISDKISPVLHDKQSESSPEVTQFEVMSVEEHHISKDTKIYEQILKSKLDETDAQQEKHTIEAILPTSVDDKYTEEIMKSTTQADTSDKTRISPVLQEKISESLSESTQDKATLAEEQHISKDTKIHEQIPASKLEETDTQQEKHTIESTLPSSIHDKYITEVTKSTSQSVTSDKTRISPVLQEQKSDSLPESTQDKATPAEEQRILKDIKIHEQIPTSKLEETGAQQEKLTIESSLQSSVDDKYIKEITKSRTQADTSDKTKISPVLQEIKSEEHKSLVDKKLSPVETTETHSITIDVQEKLKCDVPTTKPEDITKGDKDVVRDEAVMDTDDHKNKEALKQSSPEESQLKLTASTEKLDEEPNKTDDYKQDIKDKHDIEVKVDILKSDEKILPLVKEKIGEDIKEHVTDSLIEEKSQTDAQKLKELSIDQEPLSVVKSMKDDGKMSHATEKESDASSIDKISQQIKSEDKSEIVQEKLLSDHDLEDPIQSEIPPPYEWCNDSAFKEGKIDDTKDTTTTYPKEEPKEKRVGEEKSEAEVIKEQVLTKEIESDIGLTKSEDAKTIKEVDIKSSVDIAVPTQTCDKEDVMPKVTKDKIEHSDKDSFKSVVIEKDSLLMDAVNAEKTKSDLHDSLEEFKIERIEPSVDVEMKSVDILKEKIEDISKTDVVSDLKTASEAIPDKIKDITVDHVLKDLRTLEKSDKSKKQTEVDTKEIDKLKDDRQKFDVKRTVHDFIQSEIAAEVVITEEPKSNILTSIAGPSKTDTLSSTPPKITQEESSLSGKSTPDIADIERERERQETLKFEKHIPGCSTPPTVPVSPIVKDTTQEEETFKSPSSDSPHETKDKKLQESTTISVVKEKEVRSSTPGSDDCEYGVSSTHSDISSSQMSRAPNLLEGDRHESDDDDMLGSPLSVTSQIGHSPSLQYDFEDDKKSSKNDQMNMSFYGTLPGEDGEYKCEKLHDDEDVDFEKAIEEHRQTRGEDLANTMSTSSYLYEITTAKYTTKALDVQTEIAKDEKGNSLMTSSIIAVEKATDKDGNEKKESLMTSSFIGVKKITNGDEKSKQESLMTSSFIGTELPGCSIGQPDEKPTKDPIESWGKPLGLPSPVPPNDNKGTPKKERKLPPNVTAKNKLNDDRKRSDSPSKHDKKKKFNPVYVDLTYVPHHGNSNYSYVDFFKRIRARYYVFSGIEPSKEVYNALLEAKQTWEDKNLGEYVSIIFTL